ncbi:MAG: urate oxidase, partial [Verrucomicrobiota bacterium]|nr:urate oxidase [Verrucomicrobiota bacterium]
MAKLIEQRYGKAQVRVLKILRDGAVHTIREVEVLALLAGDFETSYTADDNSKVVPTDTIKNTINVFTKQHLVDDLELFAVILGEHFVKRYEQVARATIEVTERVWDR